jgi:RimJ/RimL family protein N-acetyltransferase
MRKQPTLITQRLILRPFSLEDAAAVQQLAGAREIAATTLHIPHPYEDGMAETWIQAHSPSFENGTGATFAVVLRVNRALCGAIGLAIERRHSRAELGYWIGVPYWDQGYATEAARAVVRYAFASLALHRVHAMHMRHNPASGRVLQKIGMTWEGRLRQHVLKWGQFQDLEIYGLLRSEWRPE